jgi:hypothetical protein
VSGHDGVRHRCGSGGDPQVGLLHVPNPPPAGDADAGPVRGPMRLVGQLTAVAEDVGGLILASSHHDVLQTDEVRPQLSQPRRNDR